MEENEIIETMPETTPEDIPETEETTSSDSGEDIADTGTELPVPETVVDNELGDSVGILAVNQTISGHYYVNGLMYGWEEAYHEESTGLWYAHDTTTKGARFNIKYPKTKLRYCDSSGNVVKAFENGYYHPDYIYLDNIEPVYKDLTQGQFYYFDSSGNQVYVGPLAGNENVVTWEEYLAITEPEEPTTEEPIEQIDYTEILKRIENDLAELKEQNTYTLFDKPLSNYSVTEGISVLIFVFLFLSFLIAIVFRKERD